MLSCKVFVLPESMLQKRVPGHPVLLMEPGGC